MSRYRFTRYVNFSEMAEGIVIEIDSLKKAIRKAVLLCNEPNTVLVLDADRIEELEAKCKREFDIATGYHKRWLKAERKYEALVDNIMEYLDVDAVEWATESGDPPVDIVDFANSIRALLENNDGTR